MQDENASASVWLFGVPVCAAPGGGFDPPPQALTHDGDAGSDRGEGEAGASLSVASGRCLR